MASKVDKRKERSLAYFANKKANKAKQQKNDKYSDARIETLLLSAPKYCINFVLSDVSMVLVDESLDVFPSAHEFLAMLKHTYENVHIILFSQNKAEGIIAQKLFPQVDAIVDTDDAPCSTTTPLLVLRKFVVKKFGIRYLMGPFVLLCKTMNANNNQQYDIVKDIRRFYVFENNLLKDIDQHKLITEIKRSVEQFF